jgi:hypothetical protein
MVKDWSQCVGKHGIAIALLRRPAPRSVGAGAPLDVIDDEAFKKWGRNRRAVRGSDITQKTFRKIGMKSENFSARQPGRKNDSIGALGGREFGQGATQNQS